MVHPLSRTVSHPKETKKLPLSQPAHLPSEKASGTWKRKNPYSGIHFDPLLCLAVYDVAHSLPLEEDQFGFRKGKGTRDAIGLMRIISERDQLAGPGRIVAPKDYCLVYY